MRIAILLLGLFATLFALSTNQKIVIDKYKSKSAAREAFARYQNDPFSIVSRYADNNEFIVHYRKSGNHYVIVAEPFKNHNDAQQIFNKISSHHPKAYISQGIADDIQFLLTQHRNQLSQQQQQNNLLSQKAPTIIPTTPLAKKLPQTVQTKPTFSYNNYLIEGLLGAIIILIGYIIFRERRFKKLLADHHHLSEEKEQIQNAMQAKNDFIAMMSHEIRAPINAIMGMSHLILESKLTVTQRSQLTKIKDSASVLLTLINDILDHSKIEAGKITIEQIPFDLNALLDDISNIISHKAQEKQIELIFDVDHSVPNKLIGDPLRLLQVLVNLLNNAVKFTEEGSVILRARAQHISRLNLKIHFDVIDTGIGMAPDQIEKLFVSYAQADETITRKYGGTGLGLAICKNLVTLMGGAIQVNSNPNSGSTFSFDIKLHSDFDYEKRHYRLPTAELMSKNGLILETNTESAAVLQRGLEYFHYEIKVVKDSLDAVALMQNYLFDIVFIDTRMALCGAFKKELQSQIKSNDLKLVWMGEDIKKRGGVILPKPYNQLTIYNTVLSLYGYLDQEGQHQNNTRKLKESLKKFAGETLLLAEDNEINRSIIAGLLAGTDIAIITATTGKEAVDIVEVNPNISVILMDIQMPIMDGFEASRLIRDNSEKDFIPIIAVTGNTLERDIQKISNAGMNGHIVKPIDVNTFYTTLFYAFEKSRNQSRNPKPAFYID